ncbi:uncharacterized protein METZ01_LOCUS511053, partial [marine metagenome]
VAETAACPQFTLCRSVSDDTRTADSSVTTASHGPTRPARDHHSWSNPEQIRVRHLDLDWVFGLTQAGNAEGAHQWL